MGLKIIPYKNKNISFLILIYKFKYLFKIIRSGDYKILIKVRTLIINF